MQIFEGPMTFPIRQIQGYLKDERIILIYGNKELEFIQDGLFFWTTENINTDYQLVLTEKERKLLLPADDTTDDSF